MAGECQTQKPVKISFLNIFVMQLKKLYACLRILITITTMMMIVNIIINIIIIIIMQVKKHYACLRIPPVCAEWVNKMETRWREENITR